MFTDPIADLLTRIRNAVKARKSRVVLPHSKMKVAILDVLKKHHYVQTYAVTKNGPHQEIEIELNEEIRELNLDRVSRPGQRIYIKKEEIKPVLNGYGIAVLSTPKGIMTGDEARKQGVGGEYICNIW